MEAVDVRIVETQYDIQTGGTAVGLSVTNQSESDVWLVSDRWFVCSIDGAEIKLSFARARHRESVEIFGYFVPEVERLEPGVVVRRAVDLNWPLTLSAIWNDQRSVWPAAGRYRLQIEFGYGRTAPPVANPEGDSVEHIVEGLLDWQLKATSPAVEITVPPRPKEGALQ